MTQWNIGALAFGQQHYGLALAAFLLADTAFREASSPRVEEWHARHEEEA